MSISATAEPKRLLLLHSMGLSPWELFTQRIREELARQYQEPLDLYEASLAETNFVDPSADARFGDYLRALLGNQQPDLIISVGGPAVAFSQRYRDHFFPQPP
jgi:hypothetical protein